MAQKKNVGYWSYQVATRRYPVRSNTISMHCDTCIGDFRIQPPYCGGLCPGMQGAMSVLLQCALKPVYIVTILAKQLYFP